MSVSLPKMKSPAPNQRREMLALAAAAFVLVLIVWQIGALDTFLFPLRLYVSLIHEMGHGLTAILTGGRFLDFEVFPNGSGLARYIGGSSFLVPQMGYLGAALFGAVLLVLTNRTRDPRLVAYGVAVLIGGCVILFTGASGVLIPLMLVSGLAWIGATKSSARFQTPLRVLAALCGAVALALVWSNIALRLGLIGAGVLAVLAAFTPRQVTIFVLNFLALVVGLNAITDIWFLFGNLNAGVGNVPNDAAAMAIDTGLPTVFWVILWVVLALLMIGAAMYIAFIQPLRHSVRSAAAQSPIK